MRASIFFGLIAVAAAAPTFPDRDGVQGLSLRPHGLRPGGYGKSDDDDDTPFSGIFGLRPRPSGGLPGILGGLINTLLGLGDDGVDEVDEDAVPVVAVVPAPVAPVAPVAGQVGTVGADIAGSTFSVSKN